MITNNVKNQYHAIYLHGIGFLMYICKVIKTQKYIAMKTQIIYYRGTEINKVQFSELEHDLERLGLNVNDVFEKIADEKEFAYVSNGFLMGLSQEENAIFEWHHYFVKQEDGSFEAERLSFNN